MNPKWGKRCYIVKSFGQGQRAQDLFKDMKQPAKDPHRFISEAPYRRRPRKIGAAETAESAVATAEVAVATAELAVAAAESAIATAVSAALFSASYRDMKRQWALFS